MIVSIAVRVFYYFGMSSGVYHSRSIVRAPILPRMEQVGRQTRILCIKILFGGAFDSGA